MRRSLVLGLTGLFLAALPASIALAQVAPQYTGSEPADGAKMHKAPGSVTVTFTEPLDASSKMVVKDHCGNRLDDGNVTVSLNELSVGIKKTPAGHYMVTYTAVGFAGLTGSTNGAFSFEVHAGDTCNGGAGHQHGGAGMNTGNDHPGHSGGSGHSGHSNDTGHDAGSTHGSSGDHSGDQHSDTGGSGHADHADHEAGGGGKHQDHEDTATNSDDKKQNEQRLTQIATGGSPYPGLGPDPEAVLMSLGLAAAFGLLGGWVLRVSTRT